MRVRAECLSTHPGPRSQDIGVPSILLCSWAAICPLAFTSSCCYTGVETHGTGEQLLFHSLFSKSCLPFVSASSFTCCGHIAVLSRHCSNSSVGLRLIQHTAAAAKQTIHQVCAIAMLFFNAYLSGLDRPGGLRIMCDRTSACSSPNSLRMKQFHIGGSCSLQLLSCGGLLIWPDYIH